MLLCVWARMCVRQTEGKVMIDYADQSLIMEKANVVSSILTHTVSALNDLFWSAASLFGRLPANQKFLDKFFFRENSPDCVAL